MRIVTRPDFDGIVCAVLLYEALDIKEEVHWVEPNELQNREVEIKPGDIIANLPYHENTTMWFDHHVSNIIETSFEGAHEIAPSAAGIIYKYYEDKFQGRYDELIFETDKIDSADLSLDEVNNSENYPYVLLSMTIRNRQLADKDYWAKLIDLLRNKPISEIMKDPEVSKRCEEVVKENHEWKAILKENTRIEDNVSVLDLRKYGTKAPSGNRFMIYSMFPETNVSMKLRYADTDDEKLIVSVGHSIFNKACNVNVGKLLSRHNGGGHRGAGACSMRKAEMEEKLALIIEILRRNEPCD